MSEIGMMVLGMDALHQCTWNLRDVCSMQRDSELDSAFQSPSAERPCFNPTAQKQGCICSNL